MKIQEIMTADVKSCRPETNLAEAVKAMWDQDCGALPVVDTDRKVVGMITDRDICIAVGTRGRSADRIPARDVMTKNVYTCLGSDEVNAALQRMKEQRVRRLPVVDADGRLAGIVSLNDVVLHAGAARPDAVVSTLTSICEHRRALAAAGAA